MELDSISCNIAYAVECPAAEGSYLISNKPQRSTIIHANQVFTRYILQKLSRSTCLRTDE